MTFNKPEYNKTYYERNKEYLKEYYKQAYYKDRLCCECGATFLKGSLNNHIKSEKHNEYLDMQEVRKFVAEKFKI